MFKLKLNEDGTAEANYIDPWLCDAVATAASQVALYKRMYPKGVADSMYKKSVGLADCKKKTDFGGEGAYINIATSGTSGGSADFPTALANQGPSTQKRFFVTHKTEYQVASVTGKAIATSNNDKMAILKVLKAEMDKANYKFTLALSSRYFGNGGGSLGVISSGSATTTITLTLASDAVKFEIGDWIQFSSDNGTGSAPAGVTSGAGGDQIRLTDINRSTGTLTAATAFNTIGATDAYYIFRAGDYANAMTGLGGWNPITAPTGGDSFFGMDRSVGDLVRQAGDRYANTSGYSMEDTLLNASAQVANLSSRLTRCYVNPITFNGIVKELGSKRIVDATTREANTGFKGIQVYTGMGVVEVVADSFMPQGYGRMVDPDDITLMTAGECPNPLNWGGAQSTQVLANADALQFRIGCYGEFGYEMNNIPTVVTF
jgi:microcompartment protein CcmK/EutM